MNIIFLVLSFMVTSLGFGRGRWRGRCLEGAEVIHHIPTVTDGQIFVQRGHVNLSAGALNAI